MAETGFAEYSLGLLQNGAFTNLFENLSVNSLKEDSSNATTFNPPLFSLVDTFKGTVLLVWIAQCIVVIDTLFF
jgi:hypothetical protein